MRSIYSPRQIQVATFFGGPFAAAYFLKSAFESVNKKEIASKALIISLITSALIIFILPFLPEKTPNNLIPILYLIPVTILLNKQYITKEEILASEEYKIESSWKVFGISLISVFLYGAIAISYLWVSQSSDDIAQNLVENVNNSDIELNPDYFIKLEAHKDENGSGVFLNFTLTNGAINEFKNASQAELRPTVINFIGKEFLRDLVKENIYIIVHFQTQTDEVVNKVILSPSNID
ncbi:hypothetical protein L1286_20580 [Pseudoalteromonas sp. SMS1]|uniref:hypothetical protein n=1 Tax=Pseudoalteromonas sp. SMS1 TaxID=2908894 RepID=UPI001F19F976|nr:hypothetical protein [Pseudoalteromonas sp. SMS1]MCF2859884.1 hypothetical protein [Pseudoalteromonas sp. SMS1]